MCEQNHPRSNFRGGGQQCTARWIEEETNEALNYVSQIPGHVGEFIYTYVYRYIDREIERYRDR